MLVPAIHVLSLARHTTIKPLVSFTRKAICLKPFKGKKLLLLQKTNNQGNFIHQASFGRLIWASHLIRIAVHYEKTTKEYIQKAWL
jgi:hypothetical protein